MTNRIDAVYENGVFRPVNSVNLAQGARVRLAVEPAEEASSHDPQRLARALEEIAAMPLEGAPAGFDLADHDKILYGGEDGR
jgi:predicted DNA-binding antitoxin AbrB/MazE fold protein